MNSDAIGQDTDGREGAPSGRGCRESSRQLLTVSMLAAQYIRTQ